MKVLALTVAASLASYGFLPTVFIAITRFAKDVLYLVKSV
jgi:hypothetical protein